MAIADLLAKLVELKSQLVANLSSMGVTADESEKLNTLVPKVLECKADVIWSKGTVSKEVTSVNIPNGVTSIGYDAFSGCKSLASITIPGSVTSIEGWAFDNCSSLASITIPDSVTSMGYRAFYRTALLANQTGVKYADTWVVDCDKDVTSVEIKDGIRGIANSAFSGCSSLTSVKIPSGVTSIGDEAFNNCSSLANITIPDSVTSIGHRAFNKCTSLANIYYKGTEEQWNAITKGNNWNFNMGANVSGGTVITYNYTG